MVSPAHRTPRARESAGDRLFLNQLLGTSLKLDLNGDRGVVVSGGAVTDWLDQSGRGNHATQATSARRPTVSGTALNGRVGIGFVKASVQWLGRASFTGLAAADKPRFYIVARQGAVDGGLFELSDSAATNRVLNAGVVNPATSTFGTFILNPGGPTSRAVTVTSITSPFLLSCHVNASDQTDLTVNGTNGVSAATAGGLARTPDRYTIGVLADQATFPLTGTIYRIVVVNPAPAAAVDTLIQNYLRFYYGL